MTAVATATHTTMTKGDRQVPAVLITSPDGKALPLMGMSKAKKHCASR